MKKCVFMILAIVLITSSCAKKQISTSAPVQAQQPATTQSTPKASTQKTAAPQKPTPTPLEIYELKYSQLPQEHKVVKGECLWWIAEYKTIYNDPFMWPLIYKANRSKIKNPDLIYPGQVFSIPRNFTMQELKKSRHNAGAPRPYTPPEDANLPAKLRQELGWQF